MKKIALAFVTWFLVSGLNVADASASGFSVLESAYKNGHAPTEKQLTSALWLAVALATAKGGPQDQDGVWPMGKIPCGAETCTQIAQFKFAKSGLQKRVTGLVTVSNSFGIELGATRHHGTLGAKDLELVARGGTEMCATKSLCRMVASARMVCAQSNNDSRKSCQATYKNNPNSYIAYVAAHP